MTAYVALLRAVNLGRHGKVAMPALKAMAEGMGLESAQTLLQTGNLVFNSGEGEAALTAALEAKAEATLGLRTAFILRSAAQWRAVIGGNPFPAEAERDPAHLVVMALKAEPAARWLEDLRAAIKGPEQAELHGRDLYISYPDGIGRSKLSGAAPWRRLGTPGTARNWNTVLKIAAVLER